MNLALGIDDREVLLSVRGLNVRYRLEGPGKRRLHAVRDVDLDIRPGEIFALVGESGSGKSSLANAVLQLVPTASGALKFDGTDLAGGSRDRRRPGADIQAVFQDPLASLSPRRTVFQSVREPLDQLRIGAASERADHVYRALQEVGLDPALAGRYPHELSGGERQRVALARAIAPRPRLIVADEPVSSLDLSVQVRMVRLIRELRDRLGIAFLFISHDLSVVRRIADRVAVMYLGRIVESGPAAALFDRPAHPYTRALLEAVPVPDPDHLPPRVPPGDPPSPLTPPTGCVFHTRCTEALPLCAEQPPVEQEIEERNPDWAGHRASCHLCKR
jgi:oligopeptide/dipeptide ABC transporter ATP-binding protein